MDVLHFLKTHHDGIRDGFGRLADADGVKARRTLLDDLGRELQAHLVLEKDYLYPEINDLFAGADAVVAVGLANAATISKRLKALTKIASKPANEQADYGKRMAELRETVVRHFEQEEQALMPKLRLMMRTEDREDLGQVFLDVKSEVLASLAPEAAAPVRTPSRKRA